MTWFSLPTTSSGRHRRLQNSTKHAGRLNCSSRNSSRRYNFKISLERTRTRFRNAPAPKVSGRVSEANCEAAARPRADMGCAFDAPDYAIYQIQVSCELQLFSVRRIHPSRYLAEKGSYAEPLVLWDSTSSGKPSPTRKCTIFTGV